MFNLLNIDSPFYINNNFDFDSSDSETDSDSEMSVMNQLHTSGSQIHKKLIEFFELNKIPDETLTKNNEVFKRLFEAPIEKWNDYSSAVNSYTNDDTEEERLKKAIMIGDAAVSIRESSDMTKLTIITDGTKEVNITNLSIDEVALLKELHELVLTKMQGNGQKGSAEKANQMVAEFKRDMNLAKIDGTFPHRWVKNHGVWKCCEHEKRLGNELKYSVDDADVVDKEGWVKVVEAFNRHKDSAPPQQGSTLANASNKFAVDVYCATINRFKTKMPEANRGYDQLRLLLQKVAAFQNKSSVKKTDWMLFIAANPMFKNFLNGLDENNSLYDNPGKLTKARLFACAASMFPAPEPLALFGVNDRLSKIPKMIALIYSIEKKFNIIDKAKATTSSSEHLCHLMLTLGSQNAYVWNRNKIPHSIRDTKFNLNNLN